MADSELKENNETKAKYKFGQNEIDYDLYIKNLSNNVQNYIASKNWSEGQILAFTRAYNEFINGLTNLKDSNSSRLYTDEFGTIFDTDSIIDKNKENYWVDSEGNLYQDLNEIAKRKDRNNATQFSAYRELAGYANIIGKGILNKLAEREATPTKQTDNLFDFNKHGFEEYFGTQINPAGIDFKQNPAALSSFYEMDPYNKATGKRALTNRAAYFKGILQQYKDQLGDYDFSNTAYKTKENYLSLIDTTINGLNDGVINDLDKRNLMQLGVRPDTFLGFFDTRENPNISKEEQDAINALNEETANTSKVNQLRLQFGDKSKQIYNEIQGVKDTKFLNLGDVRITPKKESLVIAEIGALGYLFPKPGNDLNAYKNEISNVYYKFVSEFLAELRTKPYNVNTQSPKVKAFMHYTWYMDSKIPGSMWKPVKSDYLGTDEYYYFDDPANDKRTHSILIWNKTLNRLFYTWLLNVPESQAGQWLVNQGKNYINLNTTDNDTPYAGRFEEGGQILTLQYGGYVPDSYVPEEVTSISEYTQKNNVTPTQARENQRNVFEDFTTRDFLRLAALAVDFGSMFTDPLTGGLMGLGSTAIELGTDMSDPAVTAGLTAANAGINLAFDVLGLVPTLEGLKILKNIKPISPKVVRAITYGLATAGAVSTLSNSREIIHSYLKLQDDEPITAEDLRNMILGAKFIIENTRAIKGRRIGKRAVAKTTVDDKLGILIVKTSNGEKQDIVLEGDNAKLMREYIANNDIVKANQLLSRIYGKNSYTIGTNISLPHRPAGGMRVDEDTKKANKWINRWAPLSSYTRKINSFPILDPSKYNPNEMNGKYWSPFLILDRKPLAKGFIEVQTPGNRSARALKGNAESPELAAYRQEMSKYSTKVLNEEKKALEDSIQYHLDLRNLFGIASPSNLKYIFIRQEYLLVINELLANKKAARTSRRASTNSATQVSSNKFGGNIAKVRFMLNGGSSVNYSSLIDEYLKSLNAAQGIKYDLSYNQVGNRTWTNFNNATADDYANDAAYREITTNNPNFAFASTSKKDLAKALEETNAFQNFNNYLHNKQNAIEYFKAISNSNSAPQAAKLYANTQLETLNNITTDDLTEEQWNSLFKARRDRKPGTYYYTPVALTPSNTLSFYYNESSRTFKPVSDGIDVTQFDSDTRYYTTPNGTYTESTFYYPNNSGSTLTAGAKSNSEGNGTNATVPDDDKKKRQEGGTNTTGLKAKLSRFLPYAMDLGRILQLNDVNRHLADIKAESLVPYLQNPSEFYLPVYGNLRAVLEGNQAAAILNKKGNEALTSDASLQLATALQAASMGNEYIQTGNKSDAEMIRDTAEKSTAQSKENMENRHKTAALNRLSLLQTLSNLKDLEQATYSHNANNWDIFFQSLVKGAKTAQTKQEQRQLAYDLQQYLDDLLQNPTKYIKRQWDPLFIEVLNNPSKQLTEEERQIVANEAALYNKILKWLAATRQGIYAERPNEVPLTFKEVISVKKGGTISKERIRAKIKDADRFHDSVKELIKEHNKKQDRVAKSMYRYPKVKVV